MNQYESMTDKTEVQCPECDSKMHRMGKIWSGRKQVQRYRCPKCGRTYAPVPSHKDEEDTNTIGDKIDE